MAVLILGVHNDIWISLLRVSLNKTTNATVPWMSKVTGPTDSHWLYMGTKYLPSHFFPLYQKIKNYLISHCYFNEVYLLLQNYQWKGLFHHNHNLYQLDPAGDPSDVCGAFHSGGKKKSVISVEKRVRLSEVLKST